MKKVFFMISLIFMLSNCASSKGYHYESIKNMEDLANRIILKMSPVFKKRIAVLNFLDVDGRLTETSRLVTEVLQAKLVESQKIIVISNRYMYDTITNLPDRPPENRTEKRITRKIGGQLKVDTFCFGKIAEMGDEIIMNIKLISVSNGKLYGLVTAKISRDMIFGAQSESISSDLNNIGSDAIRELIDEIDWGPMKLHFLVDKVRFIGKKALLLQTTQRFYEYRPVLAAYVEAKRSFNPDAPLAISLYTHENKAPRFQAVFFDVEGEEISQSTIVLFEPEKKQWNKGELRQAFFILPPKEELEAINEIKIEYWP